jgi:hypothetical protein
LLERLYADRGQPGQPPASQSIWAIADFCCDYRFQALQPAPGIGPWLTAGQQLLATFNQPAQEPGDAQAFREHLAWWHLSQGRAEEARAVLQAALEPARMDRTYPRIKARILGLMGEVYRVLDCRFRAGRMLRAAERLQVEHEYHGDLADLTLAYQAKWCRRLSNALGFLRRAKETQVRLADRPGLVRSLLLEARLAGPGHVADANRAQIDSLVVQLPALAQCGRLRTVLENWTCWTAGDQLPQVSNSFWGI